MRPHYQQNAGRSCHDCDRPAAARGLCTTHYSAWRQTHPEAIRPRGTAAERFQRFVKIDSSGCWLWTGTIDARGYSSFRGDRVISGHRFAYELAYGPIPAGLSIDHVCHNDDPLCHAGPCRHRRCVNPAHLEAVTLAENTARSPHTRGNRSHCPAGHSYAEHGRRSKRGRFCLICHKAAQRAYRARKANAQAAQTLQPTAVPA